MTQPPNQPGPQGDPNWAGAQPQGTPNQQPHPQNPYGQSPYGQQAYGQQVFGQPGQYGSAGVPPQAFPEPQRSGGQTLKRILSVLVSIVLVGGGAYAIWNRFQSEAALEAGNCLVISGEADDADHEQVDCDDADTFSYEVAMVLDGTETCGAEYGSYTITEGSSTDKAVCLFENFQAERCYDEEDSVMGFAVVDCPGGVLKVAAVEDAVDAVCPDGSEVFFVVPEPARTFCVTDPA